jgi:hypothetical protein
MFDVGRGMGAKERFKVVLFVQEFQWHRIVQLFWIY